MIMKSPLDFSNLVIPGLIIIVAMAITSIAIVLLLHSISIRTSITDIATTATNTFLTLKLAWGVGLSIGTSSLPSPSSSSNIKLDVTSEQQIHAIAGQFINIDGTITNLSPTETVKGGIAYISLVDLKDKIPVDLEDWSAQKGLYIPSIAPSQSLPLEWKVRLVKAGSYTISMLFIKDGDFSRLRKKE